MQKLNLYSTEYIVQNACDKSKNYSKSFIIVFVP